MCEKLLPGRESHCWGRSVAQLLSEFGPHPRTRSGGQYAGSGFEFCLEGSSFYVGPAP